MASVVIAQQNNGDIDANRACSSNRPKVTVCNGDGNDDCNSDGYYVRLVYSCQCCLFV